jgi:hypothetical protein
MERTAYCYILIVHGSFRAKLFNAHPIEPIGRGALANTARFYDRPFKVVGE